MAGFLKSFLRYVGVVINKRGEMKMRLIVMMLLMASSMLMAITPEEYERKKTNEFIKEVESANKKLDEAKQQNKLDVKKAISRYIAALERLKIAYTKRASLDKAIKMRDEIEKYKKLLDSEELNEKKEENPVDKEAENEVAETDIEKALGYKLNRHPYGAKKGPNGHYYMFVKGFSSWGDAYEKAKKMGGYLATVTTKAEFDFLCELEEPGENEASGGIFVGAKFAGDKNPPSWITDEKADEEVPLQLLESRFDHAVIFKEKSKGAFVRGIYATGKNPSGRKLVKGFFVEWNK